MLEPIVEASSFFLYTLGEMTLTWMLKLGEEGNKR